MTKFFIHLLLSAFVGLGAAVGFNPQAREKINTAWSEAETFVHAATESVFETATELDLDTEGYMFGRLGFWLIQFYSSDCMINGE